MRVFKVSDGSSWTVRVHEEESDAGDASRAGWDAIVFEGTVHDAVQRLVYRPHGWLQDATPGDLAAALEESVAVRLRWGA
jgi:hypothetical protein